MPRFYFHLCDDNEAIPDTDGLNFADSEAAKREAHAGALEMLAEDIRAKRSIDNRRIVVIAEDGDLVAVYEFKDLAGF